MIKVQRLRGKTLSCKHSLKMDGQEGGSASFDVQGDSLISHKKQITTQPQKRCRMCII